MYIVHTGQQLLQMLAGCALLKSLVLDNQFEELTTTGKLHYQVQIFICLDDLIDLHNIWVV